MRVIVFGHRFPVAVRRSHVWCVCHRIRTTTQPRTQVSHLLFGGQGRLPRVLPRQVLPALWIGARLAVCVFAVNRLEHPAWAYLLFSTVAGTGVYSCCAYRYCVVLYFVCYAQVPNCDGSGRCGAIAQRCSERRLRSVRVPVWWPRWSRQRGRKPPDVVLLSCNASFAHPCWVDGVAVGKVSLVVSSMLRALWREFCPQLGQERLDGWVLGAGTKFISTHRAATARPTTMMRHAGTRLA